MAMTVEVDDLGTLLKLWRTAAGLSLDDVAERASAELKVKHISRELVRRYEQNMFPASGPDPVTLAGITLGCGRRLRELPEEAMSDADWLSQLLRKSCFPLSALVAA